MATNYEVDMSRLNSDISRAKDSLSYLEKNIGTMFGEIKELDAMWDGSANSAFNVQFTADYEMMKEVCKNLRKLIDSMEFAKTQYVKCESNVSSTIKALRF